MQQIQRYFRKAGKAVLRFFGRVAHGSVLDIAILVCGVGLVGVGTTIAVVSSRGPQVPVDVSSAVPMSVSTSVSVPPVEQEVYDPNENALDLAEYDGTLLTESADGGEAYLEETIFIGDSNTYRLATYGLTSWQNNLSAVGMGIQHITSTPSMKFKGSSDYVYMARAVAMMQPRRIVITYGTNNTDSSVENFKNQYRTALEAIKKEWPYADIIINAIPPVAIFRSNAANTQKNIDAFNKALADLAKEDGYQFLNSSEVLKDPTTGFARTDYMIGDGLHLNEDGAKALMSYVRMHTHIVPDTRPALKDVPIHEPTPEELFNPQAAASSSSSDSTDGITVTFSIRGDKNGGTLSGTQMQLASPGKACTPVTATANEGYIMVWGCDAGRLYEGEGIATNGNQSTATYTVPAGTTEKTLNVWVTFHKHTDYEWRDAGNGMHQRVCGDSTCPIKDRAKEEHAHDNEKSVPATGSYADKYKTVYVCGTCGGFIRVGEEKEKAQCPHSNLNPNGWTNSGSQHSQVCPDCKETITRDHNYTWGEGENHIFGTCVCNATTEGSHSSGDWVAVEGGHNKTCTVCGEITESKSHSEGTPCDLCNFGHDTEEETEQS